VLRIQVQPRASQNAVAGLHGDALKIRLQAPPVDGAANRMCTDFIAELLQVPRRSVELIAGQTGRAKRLLVRAEPAALPAIEKRLLSLIA
jgi:uncharacterized protein (TIGR00251 family)